MTLVQFPVREEKRKDPKNDGILVCICVSPPDYEWGTNTFF